MGEGVALGGISGHLPIFHSPHPGPTVPAEKSAFSLALPHELLFRFSLCHGVQHFCQDVYLPSWTVRVPSAQSSRDPGQTRRPPHLTTSYHTAQRPGLPASGLLGSGDSPADGTLTGVGVPRSQAQCGQAPPSEQRGSGRGGGGHRPRPASPWSGTGTMVEL